MKTHSVGSFIGIILCGILSFAVPALAQDVTLDFEGLPSMGFVAGTAIPISARLSDQYLTTKGVVFSSAAGYVAVVGLGIGHATSGVNGIGGSTDTGHLTYNSQFPISVSFFNPFKPSDFGITDFVSVRADLLGLSSSLPTLYAYDVHGKLIGQDSKFDIGGETFTISIPGIHSVLFSGVPIPDNQIGGIALDDFKFNFVSPASSSVPEPGVLAFLVGFGISGAAFLQKRRG